MKTIETDFAPKAIGPYSQAVVSDGILYASGQIPINPESGKIECDGIIAQAEQVCKNLSEVLKAADCDFSSVLKTTCYLSDLQNFATFNLVYEQYFVSKPARSCVEVKGLPKGALVEIDLIAKVK